MIHLLCLKIILNSGYPAVLKIIYNWTILFYLKEHSKYILDFNAHNLSTIALMFFVVLLINIETILKRIDQRLKYDNRLFFLSKMSTWDSRIELNQRKIISPLLFRKFTEFDFLWALTHTGKSKHKERK